LATSVLSVNSLRKRFGSTEVLKGLNLNVAPGSIHGLVGLNGSGKTTTMECVLGMQTYHDGNIRIMGRDPALLWQGRGDVVGIFDSPAIHQHLTVRQVLEHARLLCPQPCRSVIEAERLLGISSYSNYRIKQLSLGNRRRVSIAHALLGQPAFIVMDEPFNGLDAGGVEDVLALILKLNREEGCSFLLSSHQLAYLERICTHISILHLGRIVRSGPLSELVSTQQQRLTIVCDRPAEAQAILAQHTQAEDIRIDSAGRVTLKMAGMQAAEINRLLVNAGLGVSELGAQAQDLGQIFHDSLAEHGS
jgi:ABC-type multidrug transport system ATPase subunit